MRDHVIVLATTIAIASFASSHALAQSFSPPGATACSGCHGGRDNAMPSLLGKSAADIESAMIAFRNGSREATVMDRIAKGFSESETSAIARWLAENGAGK